MHRSLLKLSCAAAVIGVFLAATPTATAAGLLGKRYASVSYDYTMVESAAYDDGDGVSLFYNHPLLETVDLGLDYQFRSKNGARDDVGDFSEQRLQVVATGFLTGEPDNIFARVGLGVGSVEHGEQDVISLAWSGVIGTEYALSDNSVLQGYAGWNDVTNDGETIDFIYGVLATFDAGDSFSVTARVEGDAHYNFTFSIGGLVRF